MNMLAEQTLLYKSVWFFSETWTLISVYDEQRTKSVNFGAIWAHTVANINYRLLTVELWNLVWDFWGLMDKKWGWGASFQQAGNKDC